LGNLGMNASRSQRGYEVMTQGVEIKDPTGTVPVRNSLGFRVDLFHRVRYREKVFANHLGCVLPPATRPQPFSRPFADQPITDQCSQVGPQRLYIFPPALPVGRANCYSGYVGAQIERFRGQACQLLGAKTCIGGNTIEDCPVRSYEAADCFSVRCRGDKGPEIVWRKRASSWWLARTLAFGRDQVGMVGSPLAIRFEESIGAERRTA